MGTNRSYSGRAFTVDSNNNISSLTEYRKGDTLITEFDMNLDEYGAITRTIDHNFGSDVTVECFLVCTAANNTYEVGRVFYLTIILIPKQQVPHLPKLL